MDAYDFSPDELWSIEGDPNFEDAAREWAEANFDELRKDLGETDLDTAVLRAHESAWTKVTAELAKATRRLGEGEYSEVVFHGARAFEGYVRAVYINPAIEQMLKPFEGRNRDVLLEVIHFAPVTLTERSAPRLLRLSLIGFTKDKQGSEAVASGIHKALQASGPWGARNRTFHTLNEPNIEQARALLENAERAVNDAAHPILDYIEKAEALRRKDAEIRKSLF